jgi:hypothetical protein
MHVITLGNLPDFGDQLRDTIINLEIIRVGGFNPNAVLTGPLVPMDVYRRLNGVVPAGKGIDVHSQVYGVHFTFVFNVPPVPDRSYNR